MPIDTYADRGYYDLVAQLDEAVQSGSSELVLLGVLPSYPSEKYGYIVPRNALRRSASQEAFPAVSRALSSAPCALPVAFFKEKPDADEAQTLISQGGLWNCGVFSFKLDYVLELLRSVLSRYDYEGVRESYDRLPKRSFDYEVVEKAQKVAVIPYAGKWKDLGTWNTLTEEMAEDYSGRVVGSETCRNTHVVNELGLPLVVLGLSDAVVVATPDGILVSDKRQSSHLKPYVAQASESRPMYEQRQWGEYRVLGMSVFSEERKTLSKELVVREGKQLSYQSHERRSERWVVTSGTGEAVLDGRVQLISPGSVVEIEKGHKHAMRAFEELHVMEVQLGSALEEEDIERYGMFWNEEGQQR